MSSRGSWRDLASDAFDFNRKTEDNQSISNSNVTSTGKFAEPPRKDLHMPNNFDEENIPKEDGVYDTNPFRGTMDEAVYTDNYTDGHTEGADENAYEHNAENQMMDSEGHAVEDEYCVTKDDVRDMEDLAALEHGVHDYGDMSHRDYLRKPGELNCLWSPNKPSSVIDLGARLMNWFGVNSKEISAGLTVCITQLVEAVSFGTVAGVSPVTAVNSTFLMSFVTTILGGRPGMISGVSTTSAMSLAKVIQNHGPEYIFYTVAFAGLMQFLFGALGLGVITRLIPFSVMAGFLNAMAVVIFLAQLAIFKVEPHLDDSERNLLNVGYSYKVINNDIPWARPSVLLVTSLEAFLAFLICFILPKWTSKASNISVAILSVAVVEWILVRQIGHAGPLIRDFENITGVITRSFLPPVFTDNSFTLPPVNMDTFQKICQPAAAIFGANLVESIMTKINLDERIGVKGHTNRMIMGQGLAQVFSSIMGGLGGSASVSQSMLNNLCGGVTTLSQSIATFSLFLVIVCAAPVVGSIPLGAIAGVMFYVSCSLFQPDTFIKMISSMMPQSLRDRLNMNSKVQRSDSIIVATVLLLTLFIDVGIAVLIGITMSVFVYAWDSGDRIMILREIDPDEETVTYYISGHIFFATKQICLETFTPEIMNEDPADVILNLEGAEIFDWSGMLALRTLHDRLVAHGKVVAFSSLSASSRRLMEKCSTMWEGINFLFIEEVTEEEKTLSSTIAGTTVSTKVAA